MRFHLCRLAIVCSLLLPGLNSLAATPATQPATAPAAPRHIVIGRDTTYVTGPVLPDGTIDYAAAAALQGPPPPAGRNAAIDLLGALGTIDIAPPLRKDFLAKLGDPDIPEVGSMLAPKDIVTRLRLQNLARNEAGDHLRERLDDALFNGGSIPWTARTRPVCARLVALNAQAIAAAHAAADKPTLYWPAVARPGASDYALPELGRLRELTLLLCLRAEGRVGAADYRGASADALAVHRLAERLANGQTMAIATLVAEQIDTSAWRIDAQIAQTCDDAKVLTSMCETRQALPELGIQHRTLESLRFQALRLAMLIARGHATDALSQLSMFDIAGMFGLKGPGPLPVGDLRDLDINVALRTINQLMDRSGAAFLTHDPQQRMARIAALKQSVAPAGLPPTFFDSLASTLSFDKNTKPLTQAQIAARYRVFLTRDSGESVEAYSQRIGTFVAYGSIQTFPQLLEDASTAIAYQRLTQTAIAQAALRPAHQANPHAPRQLFPAYMAALPDDPFTGGALAYAPVADRLTLYSVGPNGQDDHGQGDDIRWRRKRWERSSSDEMTVAGALQLLDKLDWHAATSKPAS